MELFFKKEIYIFFIQIKYYIFNVLELVIFPIICYFLLENIKFGNIIYYSEILSMILTKGPQYILVSYLIILGLTLIIRSFTKNNFMCNSIVSFLLLCITLVSYYKYKALEQPFVPSDILLIGNLNQITEFGFTGITFSMFISIIGLILLLILDFYINKKIRKKININILKRLILLVIGIVIIYITCISPNRYTKFNIKNDNGDDYAWMGANAVFFMHLGDFYNPEPLEYNEDTINAIKDEYDTPTETENTNKPNVILIMNESYSDITNLDNTTFSSNPMEIIDEIKKEANCITGEILSPVLGGGTSLPEFEVLTGLTSYFIEKQIYPYTSYIHSDMNSIVGVFNENDYTTIGIHTNTKTFYNRYNICKYLGFEKTIFQEDIENPEYKGNYISDNETANQIIKTFEENNGKKFIFTVTMQNHMPYTNKNYDEYDIEIQSKLLSETEILELKNYTQGVVDANKMYKKLVEYLKEHEEPTILIMFGDHLPLLGDSYCSTYKKNNLSYLEYYTTPYIIWANYDIEDEEIPKVLGASNLGLNILDMANIEIPWYLKPFKELYNKYPAINNKNILNKQGNVIAGTAIEDQELIINCKVLQYDLLIKKKYININN